MHRRHDGPSTRRKGQWSSLPKLADCTIDTSDVPHDMGGRQLRAAHSLRYSESGHRCLCHPNALTDTPSLSESSSCPTGHTDAAHNEPTWFWRRTQSARCESAEICSEKWLAALDDFRNWLIREAA
jgi:hypothetical protein